MAFERTRAYLLSLPRVEETLQWNLCVYWVGDKAVGGKMFATLDPEPGEAYVMRFAVPPEQYDMLLETDGVSPAPYLARAHWVAVTDWRAFREHELHAHLQAAHARVEAKLPPRTQRLLALPNREYKLQVREARTVAKAKAAGAKHAAPKTGKANP